MSSPRTYRLGIDLGTTYTAAVVCRRPDPQAPWSEPEIVALGSQSASVASVLYLGDDATVLVGEAAERRGLSEPDRVVRQFKRRIGDDIPLVVGDAVHTAHDLAARLGRWVVDKVAEREGGPAEAIAVTHPAAWGAHKKELLANALRKVGLDGVTFLPEPQAAAVAYSARERVDAGGAVAVYDLGGGTFDAAVVRRTEGGFELPGLPEGIEQLGGVDFDDRVLDHVRDGIGAALDELDFEDPDVVSAVARLRRECVEAKEALSFDTQTTIPVILPGIRTNVRLTRVEFEAAVRGSLDHTVDALRRTVESAALSPDDLQAVLLVGGSSRIPLVAQMISGELGRPVAVDSDPKTSIAMGAALTIAPRPAPAPAAPPAGRPAATVPPAPARAPGPPGSAPVPASAPGGAWTTTDDAVSGTLDIRAVGNRATGTAPPERGAAGPRIAPSPPHRSAPPGPAAPEPVSSARHGDPAVGLHATAPHAGPAPVRPQVGSAPLRPAHGAAATSAPGRADAPAPPVFGAPTAAPGQVDDEDDGPSTKRIVLIAVIVVLVVFVVAFGVGVYLKMSP